MATWNYRLLQMSDCLGIVEAYYDDEGNYVSRTNPFLFIDEVDELPKLLAMIAQAAKREIINERDESVSDSCSCNHVRCDVCNTHCGFCGRPKGAGLHDNFQRCSRQSASICWARYRLLR